jgi:hypothetical protein
MAPQIWFTGMNPPGRERISGAVGARGLPLPVRLGFDCLPPPGAWIKEIGTLRVDKGPSHCEGRVL